MFYERLTFIFFLMFKKWKQKREEEKRRKRRASIKIVDSLTKEKSPLRIFIRRVIDALLQKLTIK